MFAKKKKNVFPLKIQQGTCQTNDGIMAKSQYIIVKGNKSIERRLYTRSEQSQTVNSVGGELHYNIFASV